MERKNITVDQVTIDRLDQLETLTGINQSKLIRKALELLERDIKNIIKKALD